MRNKRKQLTQKEQQSTEALQEKSCIRKAITMGEASHEALNTMIDIAEKDLNISIRKKPGAQQ